MDYTFQYQQLSQLFSLGKENIKIPETNFRIRNLEFKSNFKMDENKADGHSAEYSFEDAQISENWNFKYPVFVPSENKNSRAIILLHGLNERDWTKYLPWAKYLAEKTGRSIILFQLAFHINRGKKEWSDPRQMNDLVNTRKNCNENIVQLSFANAALSNRLSEDPMRFYRAGLQSAHDLLSLISQIKNGEHPLFEKNTHINFIGYSIGAFLTQILFMANPNHILKESKNFLFCGGTTFNHMYGTSKLIMDNLAYEDLNDFYLNQFEKKTDTIKKNAISNQLQSVIYAFKAMIPLPAFHNLRQKTLAKLTQKLTVIGLLKDRVIPVKEIMETLKNNKGKLNFDFTILDFPYHYTHENPFPVYYDENAIQVDRNFELVFSKIARILK
jgi:hypothetical protein